MTNSFADIVNNFLKDSIGNPYGLLLSIIILFFIVSLFFAIFFKSVRKNLVSWKILEKDESPGKLLLLIVGILVVIKSIQAFVIQPFLVDGGSMLPTLKSGELLLIDKLSFDIDLLERGDVIIFRHVKNDQYNGEFFIKRLIGLPHDRVVVESGITTIYNKENPNGEVLDEKFIKYPDFIKNIDITLGEDEYLAFGDNRAESYDSRSWGVIYKKDIAGKAVFRLYPFSKIGSNPGKVDINFTKIN
jgi:signal peptidase I